MAKLTNEQIIESLKEMSILELNDLVKAIETEFGVSAAAPVAAVAGVVEEAPTEVNVKLVSIDSTKKVGAIKVFRAITGLGLMDAKKAVEACPTLIKEDIKPEEAAEIKKQFEEIGAKVEIK